jgi:hypothetical protein
MRNCLISWAGFLLLACAVLTFPVYRDFLEHDLSLNREIKAFRQIKHPPGSSRISSRKYLGLLTGNGNHCDFFIGELRRYSGEQKTIKSFYQSNPAAVNDDVGIIFIENGGLPAGIQFWGTPYRLTSLSGWLDSPDEPRDHLYIISRIGFIDFDPGWDFRCM